MRSVFALLVCCSAWLTLFGTVSEIKKIEADALESGWFGNVQGYQISAKKVYQEDGVFHSSVLPRGFVEDAKFASKSFAVQLLHSVYVVNADRLSSESNRVMLYDDVLGETQTRRGDFPNCSLSNPSSDRRQQGMLVPLATGWRCRLVSMPSALKPLKNSYDADSIAFPLTSSTEIAGPRALDDVEIMWLGLQKASDLARLIRIAQDEYHLNLDIKVLGEDASAQTYKLSGATRLWLLGASLALLIGMGLYVHGVYPAIRRELGLRMCMGARFGQLLGWLFADVMAQSFALILLSSGLALVVQRWVAVHATHLQLQLELIGFLALGALIVAVLLCLAMVLRVMHAGRAILMVHAQ